MELALEERQELATPQLPTHDNSARPINAVDLKHVLREIKSYRGQGLLCNAQWTARALVATFKSPQLRIGKPGLMPDNRHPVGVNRHACLACSISPRLLPAIACARPLDNAPA